MTQGMGALLQSEHIEAKGLSFGGKRRHAHRTQTHVRRRYCRRAGEQKGADTGEERNAADAKSTGSERCRDGFVQETGRNAAHERDGVVDVAGTRRREGITATKCAAGEFSFAKNRRITIGVGDGIVWRIAALEVRRGRRCRGRGPFATQDEGGGGFFTQRINRSRKVAPVRDWTRAGEYGGEEKERQGAVCEATTEVEVGRRTLSRDEVARIWAFAASLGDGGVNTGMREARGSNGMSSGRGRLLLRFDACRRVEGGVARAATKKRTREEGTGGDQFLTHMGNFVVPRRRVTATFCLGAMGAEGPAERGACSSGERPEGVGGACTAAACDRR
ncbi:hypothetical protein ERJ75_001509500 [Trypanosoma vivax]|nr:hypothetical protein ERJ75_001509500 [Trypanosoma vivax]